MFLSILLFIESAAARKAIAIQLWNFFLCHRTHLFLYYLRYKAPPTLPFQTFHSLIFVRKPYLDLPVTPFRGLSNHHWNSFFSSCSFQTFLLPVPFSCNPSYWNDHLSEKAFLPDYAGLSSENVSHGFSSRMIFFTRYSPEISARLTEILLLWAPLAGTVGASLNSCSFLVLLYHSICNMSISFFHLFIKIYS